MWKLVINYFSSSRSPLGTSKSTNDFTFQLLGFELSSPKIHILECYSLVTKIVTFEDRVISDVVIKDGIEWNSLCP